MGVHDSSLEGYCQDVVQSTCKHMGYHACASSLRWWTGRRRVHEFPRWTGVDRVPLGAGIEALRKKREIMVKKIKKDEGEKQKMEIEAGELTQQINELEEGLKRHKAVVQGCDEAIRQAESAYQNILESSHNLLANIHEENEKLGRVSE